MSHLLPIAPIKTYLCKQEPWPNDWLGACLQGANCLKPGMPNHRGPLCLSQVTGSAESRDRLPEAVQCQQRRLGDANIKHIYAGTSRMHSFTEVKVNRALLDCSL